jgi:carboxyl-terminal processing protease
MYGRPFENLEKVWVILPNEFSSLNGGELDQAKGFQNLLNEHRRGIEDELGCKMEFTTDPNVVGPKWFIGPTNCNILLKTLDHPLPSGPEIFLDRKTHVLISNGTNPEEVTETFSYLRSLGKFEGGFWKIGNCKNLEDAISLLYNEVKITYPFFLNKNLNWDAISQKHMPLVRTAKDPISAMQRWISELSDAHTWVRPFPSYGTFPYDLKIENNKAYFYRISQNSMAWTQGVRPGFEFVSDDINEWQERTSASSHAKAFVIGARLLATPMNLTRNFIAKAPNGNIFSWEEKPTQDRWNPVVTWRKLNSGNGYLRIEAWLLGKGLEEKIDEAFEEFKNSSRLIVDLRSNPGGNFLMSLRFRDRFLKRNGIVGWLQSTGHDGKLNEREAIVGSPASPEKCWKKEVIFLTDPLTYSASEDALLGLQGQPHVKVFGQPSGGGSGRPRALQLLEGYRLTVSTSLTFDLAENCIEGNGIPIDQFFPISYDPEVLIKFADDFHF